jgi:hypothetical protein
MRNSTALNGISGTVRRRLSAFRKRKKQKREEWHDFKAGLSCLFCGFSHPAVIDFPPPRKKVKQSQRIRAARAVEEAHMKRQRSASLYAPTATAFCTTMKEREKKMSDLPEHFAIANKIR